MPPAAAQPPQMSRRVDLSLAAALIHSELLGTAARSASAADGPAAASVAAVPARPPQGCSPAASGCCPGGGHCAAAPATAAAAGMAVAAYQTVSIVTSTDTSAGAAGVAGATSWAVGGDVPLASHAAGSGGLSLQQQWRQRAGIMDSDCEGDEYEEVEREDYGFAVEGIEDAIGGAAQQGRSGGAVRRQEQRWQGAQRAYVYGNYRRYYGYRLGQAFGEDPRLQVRRSCCCCCCCWVDMDILGSLRTDCLATAAQQTSP